MGCTKQLTLTPATSGQTPLDTAVYVASTDKIYGTMGPYILKFNATTGAYESSAIISSPAEGPCGLCYHSATGMLYASVWNGKSGMWATITRPERDIFPIDPITLEIGAGLGVYALHGALSGSPTQGPWHLVSYGSYIYYVWVFEGQCLLCRVDPTAPAIWAQDLTYGDDTYDFRQFTVYDDIIYYPYPSFNASYYYDITLDTSDYVRPPNPDRALFTPVAVDYCSALGFEAPYNVTSDKWLWRLDDYATNAYTQFDISDGVNNPNPMPAHIRYCAIDELLYIPCPNSGCVVLFDPVAGAVTDTLLGFDTPFDVVFTNTKIWAVQLSKTGLKEIA